MQSNAIIFYKHGGPSVLKFEAAEVPRLGPKDALIRHTAVGLNMSDVYTRKGIYGVSQLPSGIGYEAAGVIEAVGRSVKNVKPGDRVAYTGGGTYGAGHLVGAYSELRVRPAEGLTRLPGWMDERTAAACLSKGRTVQYLFNRTHKLKKGDVILFHSAAGGVGSIASQWAKAVGATMIGTVGSAPKARLAKRLGCSHVIQLGKQNLLDEVMRITKGQGVDVVYDSIGKDYWEQSIACVKRLGLFANFGMSSGRPPDFNLIDVGRDKSIYFTRTTSANYMHFDADRQASARALFRMIRSGAVQINIGQTFALRDAAKAHRALEARQTTGSTVLIP